MNADQKVTLRIQSLQQAITLNQQKLTAEQKTGGSEQVLEDAQKIYDFLTKDETAPTVIKPIVN